MELNLCIQGTDNMHHSSFKLSRMSAGVKCLPIFQSALSRDSRVLVQRTAV